MAFDKEQARVIFEREVAKANDKYAAKCKWAAMQRDEQYRIAGQTLADRLAADELREQRKAAARQDEPDDDSEYVDPDVDVDRPFLPTVGIK